MAFTPQHINATREDFLGNGAIGRYVILPGSPKRAKEISQHFTQIQVKPHPRGHDLHLGKINSALGDIDVATISTGMGTSSTEIIMHELFELGARRFLRVGTAGSLQPYCNVGDIVVATAAVRDESATQHYVPIEYPAVASHEFVTSAISAAASLNYEEFIHAGIVHSKSTLYAREFAQGPLAAEHNDYGELMENCNVIASEMETSMVLLFAQIHNKPTDIALSGSICLIVSNCNQFAEPLVVKPAEQKLIKLALATIADLYGKEHS